MKDYRMQSTTELTTPISAEMEQLQDSAKDYAKKSRADSTLTAYSIDWNQFLDFCAHHDLASLPSAPTTVALFISYLAETMRPSSIQRKLASISIAHRTAGHDSPTYTELVRSTLMGIKRSKGTAKKQPIPVRVRHIREGMPSMRVDLKGIRDAAIILVGYSGALRRSELVGLDVKDLAFVDEGLVLNLRFSKTDQVGEGVRVALRRGSRDETCPVIALQRWLEKSGISEGAIFRPISKGGVIAQSRLSDKAASQVLKEFAKLVGLDSTKTSFHALRAGLITDAVRVASIASVARHSRHKSNSISSYIREATLFEENVSGMVGL